MSDAAAVEQLMAEALEAFHQAEFHRARLRFERLLSQTPDHALAWLYLGICHLEDGNPKPGQEAIERAVELDAQNADAHYWLGNACGTLGQLDRALSCYQHALELDPKHTKAGEFVERTRQLLKSREHYRTGLELLRNQTPPHLYLTLALRELLHSVALFPESPAAAELRFCAQEILRRSKEVAVMMPSDQGLEEWAQHHQEGLSGLRFLNPQQALAAYEHALGYRDDDAFAWHGLALAQALSGDVASAARSWLRVFQLDPEFDFSTLARIQRHPQ